MFTYIRRKLGWYEWRQNLIMLTQMAVLIAVAAAIVISYGWLTLNYPTLMWWIGMGILSFVLFLLGGWVYQAVHKCERQLVPLCMSCEQAKAEREAALAGKKTSRDILTALVYGSQDQLDELLGLFGERVQAACNEEAQFNEKERQPLSPADQLRRQKLRTRIGQYRIQFDQIRVFAPTWELIVSDHWSAYFPDRNKQEAV